MKQIKKKTLSIQKKTVTSHVQNKLSYQLIDL